MYRYNKNHLKLSFRFLKNSTEVKTSNINVNLVLLILINATGSLQKSNLNYDICFFVHPKHIRYSQFVPYSHLF